jgi:Transposase domain (DUF772)
MLIVGYRFGIRSQRLCEEVHLNLAYRWFCRLGLDGVVPDHSTFSKTRHGRFHDADLLRELSETVVRRCMIKGLVSGEGFADEWRRASCSICWEPPAGEATDFLGQVATTGLVHPHTQSKNAKRSPTPRPS